VSPVPSACRAALALVAAYRFRLDTAEGESGRYMVSPGATWMRPEQREERLRGNCRVLGHGDGPRELTTSR
jgi:hypothetical protein